MPETPALGSLVSEILVTSPCDGVQLIQLNRTARRNALSTALRTEIAQAIHAANSDAEVRCIVLTGDDKAFAAGVEFSEVAGTAPLHGIFEKLAVTSKALEVCTKQVIAAVRGYALEGGCKPALMCDIDIVGNGARFGLPETRIGIMPGADDKQRRLCAAGKAKTRRWTLSGEMLAAAEAMALISEVVEDDTLNRTLDMAAAIAAQAPLFLTTIKVTVPLSAIDATEAKQRLTSATDLAPMATAQLVIEAVLERLDVKQALLAALEEVVPRDTILATNTSSLSVAAIGRNCLHPEQLCGMHFFNPVPLMKLVEVIPGPYTAPHVLETARHVVTKIGKVSVLAKDGPGFLVNLGGRAFYTEALHIEAEGVASPEQIDHIMTLGAGFRMGPFQLMDLTGIDTNQPVTTYIHQGFQYDPRLKTTPLHGYMVEAGRHGRKSGRGFYEYSHAAPPEETAIPTVGPKSELRAVLPEAHAGFTDLERHRLVAASGNTLPILIAPEGEDATTVAHRLGLDPRRVVAIDFSTKTRSVITVMTPPVHSIVVDGVIAWLENAGYRVERIHDSPGFVAQRILAMVINLSSEMAQAGIGTPNDIDTAMTLGLNYPNGPLAWGCAGGGPCAGPASGPASDHRL